MAKLRKVEEQNENLVGYKMEAGKEYEVYDGNTGQMIKVTGEMQQQFLCALANIVHYTFLESAHIKNIIDNKLYLAGNVSTIAEFGEQYLNMSYRQIRNRCQAVERYEEKTGLKLLSKNISDEMTDIQKQMLSLGETKFNALFSLPEKNLKKLATDGTIKTREGKEISLAELNEMTTAEIKSAVKQQTKEIDKERRALKRVNRAWQDKVHRSEEELELVREEMKVHKNESQRLNIRVAELKEIEKMYCSASLFEHKLERIKEAKENFDNAIYTFYNAGVTEEDHEKLQRELLELIGHMNRGIARAMDVYADVLPLALGWEIDVMGGNPGWEQNAKERDEEAIAKAEQKKNKKEEEK
jgi:hypothetical protein